MYRMHGNRDEPIEGEIALKDCKLMCYTRGEWVLGPETYPPIDILLDALNWIVTVNACDYEYQAIARSALREWEDALVD